MNNKRVYKIAVWSFIMLGVIIFCSVSNDRFRRSLFSALNLFEAESFSRSLKESKNNGTFLWEYEIPQKEIYYKDSIRTIHFAIAEAFAEECFSYSRYAPNYIKFSEGRTFFMLLYKEYDSHDPIVTYKASTKEREFNIARWSLKMISGEYRMPELPPDTIQIYLISDPPYDGELLPDHGDTLTVINLYKKYEQ